MKEEKDKFFNSDLVYVIKDHLSLLTKKEKSDVKTIRRIQSRFNDSYVIIGERIFLNTLFRTRLQTYFDEVSRISGIKIDNPNKLKKAYQVAIDELVNLECELDYEDTVCFVKSLDFN